MRDVAPFYLLILAYLLPYKDVRGSWKISVVFERDSVTIRHRKWEQTHDHDATHFFRFHWQVRVGTRVRVRARHDALLPLPLAGAPRMAMRSIPAMTILL